MLKFKKHGKIKLQVRGVILYQYMGKLKDLTNQKFGRLEVIKQVRGTKRTSWLCKCSCGNFKIVTSDSLKSKRVQSCGCLRKEIISKIKTTHGHRNTRLYRIWANMKSRCYNSNKSNYKYYGALGITVCSEWLQDFENFYNWSINNGYKENLTLDRVNTHDNYNPKNCRWVTTTEQQNNKENNYIICYSGQEHTLAEWSNILKMNYSALWARLKKWHWSIEKAFTTPLKRR